MKERGKKLKRQLKKSFGSDQVEADLHSSHDSLNESFTKFLDSVESSYGQYEQNLDQAQRSLEISGKEVEERNKLLRSENKKVSELLHNMRQAVFTIDKTLKIVAPVSEHTENLFNQLVVGKDIFDVLYKDVENDCEEYSLIQTTFISIFGEDDLQWDLMVDNLPKKKSWSIGSTDLKSLRITANPIFSDTDTLDKVMFIVEDVTEFERLEEQMNREKDENRQRMELIQNLIKNDRVKTTSFLVHSQKLGSDLRAEVANESSDLMILRRHLHTLKGNSRMVGFDDLSHITHKIEDVISSDNCLTQQNTRQETLEIFESLFSLIDRYVETSTQFLGIDISREAENTDAVDANIFMTTFIDDAQMTAKQLGKEVAIDLKVNTADKVPHDITEILNDCLVHVFRNAVDHGIESPEQRIALGKKSTGQLTIEFQSLANGTELCLSDDGQGIDPKLIRKKAIKTGVLSNEEAGNLSDVEALQLVFDAGMTTKDNVSNISGRGIGLDAVKQSIENYGGSVTIDSELGKGCKIRIFFPQWREKTAA